ncbi:hypothetical protein LSTR_LSTR004932 [Laodelphax striatellus]|uniref:3'-5' exonuclease domain-containing protein n=1 Tax=Laodelphax striatellus TaxID=195883 RepID=A0A482XMY8_LAOST|nr:hypothetical protein LSTR_LSTR004932 [Laodelphax striatellus]
MNYRPINMPEIVTWGAGSSRLTVENLRIRLKYSCVLGLDCEWKPETRRGERNEVALLQLAAADGYCVVYRLSELEEVPRDVKTWNEYRSGMLDLARSGRNPDLASQIWNEFRSSNPDLVRSASQIWNESRSGIPDLK